MKLFKKLQNVRGLFNGLGAASALLLAFGSASSQAGYMALFETSLGDSKSNSNFGNTLFLQYAEKINDEWKFNIQSSNSFTLRSITDENDRMNFEHNYVRTNISKKTLFTLGGTNIGLGIRYVAPTNAKSQGQGSLGVLTFRPDANFQLTDSFSLYTQLILGGHLQRRRVSFLGAANPHFIAGWRLIPSWDVTPNVYIAGDFILFTEISSTLNAEGKAHGFDGSNKLDSEIELGFKGDFMKNATVGFVVHSAGTLTGANGVRVYSPRAFDYNLRFTKEF
jgi:hypothetical protein